MFWKKLFTRQFIKDAFWSIIIIAALYGLTHNPIVRPVPKPLPGNWSIQLMQHPLLFGFAGHNFIILRDPNGMVVSEVHGLATDVHTKLWKYVGTRTTDILQVWVFNNDRSYLAEKTYPGIILKEGEEVHMKEVWNKGLACKDPINEKSIFYPPYGVSFRNETLNSNSVAYTIAKCMGLDTKHLGIWTPGDLMNLLEN